MFVQGGNLAWDIAGFPVVGRGLQQGFDETGLSGIDVLPLSKVMWQLTDPDLDAPPDDKKVPDQEFSSEELFLNMKIHGNRIRRVPYNALLLHQTLPSGDLFAQRVYVGPPVAIGMLDESLSSAALNRTVSAPTPAHKSPSSSENFSQLSASSSQTLTQLFTYSQDGFALPQQPNWSSPSAPRNGKNKRDQASGYESDLEKYATSPVLQW